MNNHQFISGNEAVVLGALGAGAEIMYGYPITPATEILESWIETASKDKTLKYLQTEDETSAGFGVIGSILAGVKAFTASAGPGHILLQDPLAMAENLRLPFVAIIMQRGGPSTGTVNFSQQEVNLAAFGGNGDGLRVVYSASDVRELYHLVAKAFSTAWKYRFPTIVLGDGYLAKIKTNVILDKPLRPIKSKPILDIDGRITHLRNCYSSEEQFGVVLRKNISEWKMQINRIAQSENYLCADADEILIAHGLVAGACREAVDILRSENKKFGLFRAITLNPLDRYQLIKNLKNKKKAYIVESSLNQFAHIVKYEAYGENVPIIEISKPAESFTAEEIISSVLRII